MSALRSIAFRVPRAAAGSRSFATSPRFLLKESSKDTNEDYESHKQDSLAKQKSGNPQWKRELASDSEEAVKADREGKESVESLQKRTKGDAGKQ